MAVLSVTLPNGTVVQKRTSRLFSHAVCSDHCVICWCGSIERAHRVKERLGASRRITIVPVSGQSWLPCPQAGDPGPELLLKMLNHQR